MTADNVIALDPRHRPGRLPRRWPSSSRRSSRCRSASWLQLVVLIVVAGRHRDPARPLHGQGLRRRRDGARRPVLRPDRAGDLPHVPGRTRRASSAGPSTRTRCSRFSIVSFLVRLRASSGSRDRCPFNPTDVPAVVPHLSFNTAVSFMTNTNWQSYGGEATMSHLTQMVGLTVQNFVSAAAGMATMAALIRGLARRRLVDHRQLLGRPDPHARSASCCRSSLVVAVVLVSQGVIQNFDGFTAAPDGGGGRRSSSSPAARPPARSPSSSSAPTAAASSTSTPPTRSRTRRRSTTSSRPGRSSSSRSRSPSRSVTW